MDSAVSAAARALARGDPLGALKRVALRDDATALALRGIAMAQLGELARSKQLLGLAARAFGAREPLARARCVVAAAEVALASRELAWPGRALESALETLEARGDRANALHARLSMLRRLLLLGRVSEAESALAQVDLRRAPAMLGVIGELVAAEVALRRLRTRVAREALERARQLATDAGIAALSLEVEHALAALTVPAARLLVAGVARPIALEQVEGVLESGDLVVDACRCVVRMGTQVVGLAARPVLFALARALGEAWPGDAPRELLIARVFEARKVDDSHRARLRVEVGRLRKQLRPLVEIRATKGGFVLDPRGSRHAVVLLPPIDGAGAALLALLSDGQAWSTSALALALGSSQRTVQRALSELRAAGKVRGIGRARARRWLGAPSSGFTTLLLLPALPPLG